MDECTRVDEDLNRSWPSEEAKHHVSHCKQCWTKISNAIQDDDWIIGCLSTAVQLPDPAFLEHLFNVLASVYYTDDEGNTALHLAVRAQTISIPVVSWLCQVGPLLDVPDYKDDTPIGVACIQCARYSSERHFEKLPALFSAIKCLLQSGADPSILNSKQELPIHSFLGMDLPLLDSDESFKECLDLLASRTQNMNAFDSNAATPLSIVVKHDAPATLRILLKNGADPSVRDGLDELPLAQAEVVEIAEILIDAWPVPVLSSTKDTHEILEHHIRHGRHQILDVIHARNNQLILQSERQGIPFLIQTWKDVDPKMDEEYSLLKVREMLLRAGCNPNQPDIDGNNAFHHFAKEQKFPSLRYLHSESIKIDKISKLESNDQGFADIQIHLRTARLLHDSRANINAQNKNQSTPLGILIGGLINLCRNFSPTRRDPEKRRGDFHIFFEHVVSKMAALGSLIDTMLKLRAKLSMDERRQLYDDMKEFEGSTDFLPAFTFSAIKSTTVLDEESFLHKRRRGRLVNTGKSLTLVETSD